MAQVIAVDNAHDLALLRIEGPPLRALRIGNSATGSGRAVVCIHRFSCRDVPWAFPATHRATLAALVPIARAGVTGKNLNPRMVARLRDPYVVFQLDALAYPGNSGSPVFDPATGDVYGIFNSVFIRETREQAIAGRAGLRTQSLPYILKICWSTQVFRPSIGSTAERLSKNGSAISSPAPLPRQIVRDARSACSAS